MIPVKLTQFACRHRRYPVLNLEQSTRLRSFSASPSGTLFAKPPPELGTDLVGHTARIQRTFDARSNALALLQAGGPSLAAHASFDPQYKRAQDWIRQHAVGPATLSPILIGGLTGALVEAAFPHGVVVRQTINPVQSLIVGVPVEAQLQVRKVEQTDYPFPVVERTKEQKDGFRVELDMKLVRVRDQAVIATGEHVLWVPDYLHM